MSSDAGSSDAEVLDIGPALQRPSRRWPGVVLLVVIVLAAAAVILDHRMRDGEVQRLGAAASAGQEQVAYSDRKVTQLADYVAPTALKPDVPQATRDGIWAMVASAAADGAADVRSAADEVGAVRVLPWHGDVRAARAAVQAQLQATALRMTTRRDPQAAGERRDQEEAAAALARQRLAGLGLTERAAS